MITKLKKWLNRKEYNKDSIWSFLGILIGASLSLLASFVLSIQALQLASNPKTTFSCDINSAVSCGAVALHPTATVFGFPNSFLGMMTEPVLITIAVALLAGVVFPRWFMLSAQIGAAFGLVFAFFLMSMSLLVIQSLCLWCLLLILSTILMFFSMLRYNIKEDNLFLPAKCQKRAEKYIKGNYDRFTMAVLMAFVIGSILFKYGSDLFA